MLFVIVGPSGGGKTTVETQMLKEGLGRVVSYTTREPRENEVNGTTYNFISKEEFNKMIDDGLMLEYQEFSGELYGMKDEYDFKNKNYFTVVAVDGLKQLKENIPDIVTSIYLETSEDNCIDRMTTRGAKPQDIEKRLSHDREHFVNFEQYIDYVVDGNTTKDLVFEEVMRIYKLECSTKNKELS